MTGRFVGLLGLMALGALYGWYADSVFWVSLGSIAGAMTWLALTRTQPLGPEILPLSSLPNSSVVSIKRRP